MSDERWIVIPNWDKFQHYKDRDPTWIKTYVSLTASDQYLALSGHRRGVLHGVWLEYARSHGQLRHDTLTLSRRLNLKVVTSDLESLNHAGFIEVAASKPLAIRYQDASDPLALARSREKIREEKNKKDTSEQPVEKRLLDMSQIKTAWVCDRCIGGLTLKNEQALIDHLENVHGIVEAMP